MKYKKYLFVILQSIILFSIYCARTQPYKPVIEYNPPVRYSTSYKHDCLLGVYQVKNEIKDKSAINYDLSEDQLTNIMINDLTNSGLFRKVIKWNKSLKTDYVLVSSLIECFVDSRGGWKTKVFHVITINYTLVDARNNSIVVRNNKIHIEKNIENPKEILPGILSRSAKDNASELSGAFVLLFDKMRDSITTKITNYEQRIFIEGKNPKPHRDPQIKVMPRITNNINKDRIAIFPFNNSNKKAEEYNYGNVISEMLTTGLGIAKTFTIVERTQLIHLIDEQKFSLTGFIDSETAIKIGNILSVEYLMFGSVSRLDYLIEVDLRIIDTVSGEVIYTEFGNCKKEENIRSMVNALTNKITDKFTH